MLNEHEDSLTVHLGDAAKGVNADDYLAFLQNALAALKELDKESSTLPFGNGSMGNRCDGVRQPFVRYDPRSPRVGRRAQPDRNCQVRVRVG